jgi:hypothetical protein
VLDRLDHGIVNDDDAQSLKSVVSLAFGHVG